MSLKVSSHISLYLRFPVCIGFYTRRFAVLRLLVDLAITLSIRELFRFVVVFLCLRRRRYVQSV